MADEEEVDFQGWDLTWNIQGKNPQWISFSLRGPAAPAAAVAPVVSYWECWRRGDEDPGERVS